MRPVHIYLGFLLTITFGVLSKPPDDDEHIFKKGGVVANYAQGAHFFIVRKDLPPPEKELKYTFIILKHSMVVPEVVKAKSYPNDLKYKDKWEPGNPTTRGLCLMLMVGRSLRTRYIHFLKQTESLNDMTFSSFTKDYAKQLTAQLAAGIRESDNNEEYDLLSKSTPRVLTRQIYEKMDTLLPISDKCKWLKTLYNTFEMEINHDNLHMTSCTENLYQTLQDKIQVKNDDFLEWTMDSPGRVYKLWSMLVFEILQGQKEPEWAKDLWPRIQSCVFEFYKYLLSYHPAIPALVSGRMIHQMETEWKSGRQTFHAHVTNDIGALSMNWTLPNSKHDYWPDPGDALMFDFFVDDTVQVSSFSGWQRSFDKIYEAPAKDFFQEYKKRNIHLTEEEWIKVCAHDGKVKPPQNMDSKLFGDPQKPEERHDPAKDGKGSDPAKDGKGSVTSTQQKTQTQ